MMSSLTRDLSDWEQGTLSAAELKLRHPRRADELVALYERLSGLGAGPVPDSQTAWVRLRERLPESRVAVPARAMGVPFGLRRLVARPLALAAVLVVLGASIGYAVAPEAVNRGIGSVRNFIEDLFADKDSEDGSGRFPEGEQPSVVPWDSGHYARDEYRYGDEGSHGRRHDEERNGSKKDSGGRSDEPVEGSAGPDDGSTGSDGGSGGSGGSAGSGGGTGGSGSSDDDSGGSAGGAGGSAGGAGGSAGGAGGSDDDGGGDDDGDDGDDDGDDDDRGDD